jgi:predicted dienelactone hydrolase
MRARNDRFQNDSNPRFARDSALDVPFLLDEIARLNADGPFCPAGQPVAVEVWFGLRTAAGELVWMGSGRGGYGFVSTRGAEEHVAMIATHYADGRVVKTGWTPVREGDPGTDELWPTATEGLDR